MTKTFTTAALATVAENTKAAYKAAAGTDRSAERIYRAELAKAIAEAEVEVEEAAERMRAIAEATGGVDSLWAMFMGGETNAELNDAATKFEVAKRIHAELRIHLDRRVYGVGPR